MIKCINLSKSYGSRNLWSRLSFNVDPGQMMAVVGQSGSGKSTLLNCIGLLETVDEGSIEVDGELITNFQSKAARHFRRDSLGYLFQNYALVDAATVYENLDVAIGAKGLPRYRKSRLYDVALDRVGLTGMGDERISRLSGGEQQRVALARLLVKKPKLVLADEPTGALDRMNAEIVVNVLRDLCDDGGSVLVATHSEYIESICDVCLRVD